MFGQAAERTEQLEEAAISGTMMGEGGAESVMSGEDIKVGGILGNASMKIMPDFVISLEGPDEMLCERVMNMPQKDIQVCFRSYIAFVLAF